MTIDLLGYLWHCQPKHKLCPIRILLTGADAEFWKGGGAQPGIFKGGGAAAHVSAESAKPSVSQSVYGKKVFCRYKVFRLDMSKLLDMSGVRCVRTIMLDLSGNLDMSAKSR